MFFGAQLFVVILLFAYPAVPNFFFRARLPCCALIFLRTYSVRSTLFCLPCCALIFLRTLLCPFFLRTYPAVLLFFFTPTLLCPHVSAHLPSCAYPSMPLFFCVL